MRHPFQIMRDTQGIAATEFALIVPILMVLFFGVVETSNLLIADAKLRAVSSSVADLVTQDADGVISAADLTFINEAAEQIMFPQPLTSLNITIIDYKVNPAEPHDVTVRWKRQLKPPAAPTEPVTPACADGSGLPPTLVSAALNDVVRVDATYTWTPAFAIIFQIPIDLSTTNYSMPRFAPTLVPGTDFIPSSC